MGWGEAQLKQHAGPQCACGTCARNLSKPGQSCEHSVVSSCAHMISESCDLGIILPSSAASHELARNRQLLQGQSYEVFIRPGTSLTLIPWTFCGSDLLTRGQSSS